MISYKKNTLTVLLQEYRNFKKRNAICNLPGKSDLHKSESPLIHSAAINFSSHFYARKSNVYDTIPFKQVV